MDDIDDLGKRSIMDRIMGTMDIEDPVHLCVGIDLPWPSGWTTRKQILAIGGIVESGKRRMWRR